MRLSVCNGWVVEVEGTCVGGWVCRYHWGCDYNKDGPNEGPQEAVHNSFMYMFLNLPHCDITFGAMKTINILELKIFCNYKNQ